MREKSGNERDGGKKAGMREKSGDEAVSGAGLFNAIFSVAFPSRAML